MKETSMIQLQSVVNFMGCLGYVLDRERKNGSFRNEGQTKRVANLHVSFDTAAKLHNSPMESWTLFGESAISRKVYLETGFSPVSVVLSYSSKLVQQSKIRFNRHGKMILDHQANLVKPANQMIANIITAE